MTDIELWNTIGLLLLLFVTSAGLGAGLWIAYKVWSLATGHEEQRTLIKQRNCDHVWHLVCRRCGCDYRKE